MRARVFISYRREDTSGYAGRIHECLNGSFPGRVFMDISETQPGEEWPETIKKQIAASGALIAVIGPNWNSDRLKNPTDFVRFEIATALQQKIRTIPVLVGGAKLPVADSLPEDLRTLLSHQSVSMSDEVWSHGCERLIVSLQHVIGKERRPGIRWIAALIIAVLALVLYFWLRNPPDEFVKHWQGVLSDRSSQSCGCGQCTG